MLPPHLRQGLASSSRITPASLRASHHSSLAGSALRPALSCIQTRSRWCWHQHRGRDWDSQLDPFYHRFTRYRTLKTRAKLLASIRRRTKWDYDVDAPLFAPANHPLIRYASHWNRPGDKWRRFGDEASGKEAAKDRDGAAADEGLELSAREKRWRQQMEEMKKRIHSDPYVAVFGTRFEPFWSPLVPSWMREEMGLAGWPKPRQETGKTETEISKDTTAAPQSKTREQPDQTSKAASLEKPATAGKVEAKAEPKAGHPDSVVHASATSWDSISNKTRKVEWDSASNVTKRFEYDPISNRMVQVQAPKPEKAPAVEPAKEAKLDATKSDSVSIPVKTSTQTRKAIPIPPQSVQPSLLAFGKAESKSVTAHDVKATAVSARSPTKPAALARLAQNDLDLLTADDVRASMGKIKPASSIISTAIAEQKAKLERDFEEAMRARDPEIDAILEDRDLANAHMSGALWNHADLELVLDGELDKLRKRKAQMEKDERGLFHVERKKREIEKINDRIDRVTKQLERLDVHYTAEHRKYMSSILANGVESAKVEAGTVSSATESKTVADSMESLRKQLDSQLQPALDRIQAQPKQLTDKLQTSLDRTAPKASTRPRPTTTEPNTTSVNAEGTSSVNIPKGWEEQADTLQAARVERTTGKPKPKPVRWIDDMRARFEAKKADFERRMQEQQQESDALRIKKLHRLQETLESEVHATKQAMWAHENHWVHRRSPAQSGAAVEKAEAEPSAEYKMDEMQGEGDLCANSAKFIGTDRWYKQSAPHSMLTREKALQQEKDRALVREVRGIYEQRYGSITAEHRQPLADAAEVTTVDPAVEAALAEGDAKREYAFKSDGLEAEIAAQERAVHESQPQIVNPALDASKHPSPVLSTGPNLVHEHAPKLVSSAIVSPADVATPMEVSRPTEAEESVSAVQWEEPPTYKVIAYDSGNDRISTVTTTSNFSNTESPMSIPDALSQLYQPARFVPHFASLQSEGYQVIFATKDLLIFKKVKSSELASLPKPQVQVEPMHATVGELLPSIGESAVRDHARLINPVDGTTRAPPEPSTGNFASPTGFVNHDPIFPPEPAAPRHPPTHSVQEVEQPPRSTTHDDDVSYVHYPRVRREERVFSGTGRKWDREHGRHEGRKHDGGIRKQNRRWRGRVKWALSVGAGTAACVYVIGVAAEMARGEASDTRRGRRQ